MKYINDTIVASASALVNQSISIIRISGSDTYSLVDKVFSKDIKQQKGYTLINGYIHDGKGNKIDEVVLACYKAPKSFTGEDSIEINCHGGILVTQKIIKLLLNLGMRMAERGEFSKRAYLNNKINLVQAEAINDLIFAENDATLKTAINSLGSFTTNLINNLSDDLLALIAQVNVNIDYPEYNDIEAVTDESMTTAVDQFLTKIKTIKEHSEITQIIKNGVETAIIGKPNVGKSSLLNALLKEDKAIVSEIQGTTRDLVEGKINLGDFSLNLIDTAGIRETEDQIEKIGIAKSKAIIAKAQLIILVVDGSKELTKEDYDLLKLIADKNYIIAVNKTDLGLKLQMEGTIKISALKQDINNLIQAIKNKVVTTKIDFNNELLLTNTRQLAYLDEIESNISQASEELKNGVSVDLVVVYLQKAWNLLLSIQGKDNQINLIDEIFKRFCLGK
ncbi:tRNA uridine-5-carboxymethylaminomethyl(34) synthesis GTPase MnmE [Spiroplasma platyhelix]|uniref:tRNA modification GTPase MnmE n=1 Tax=Spiroplasma platyhelix PALS-1 TaxID=1276218 RepID=A0A846TWX5_9MOLU|nr:tRNA uridine-5-carboxymethylaminomethyl(34) synthesis GTPase MnmE [Spiroplasma platyhelix]MBE4704178.1 tRNA modification GTPase MnmE [Spiroplasma platyhelix PALS-1]NKE38551.1 tRNA uridine-5-carboxymethylaminomethyl(34) synthesis GTPase MnmE [Spiroplasma platyhelix PALS-1]UJB29436.1 tRNA modification GTPase TrmE [Spiroplasma platyhelix PALS-1]